MPELKDVEILRSWVGDFPAGELDRIPQAQRMGGTGYIDDESELHRVWEVFQSDEPVPNVDFPGDLVLFVHNVQFYNRVSIGQVRLENGVAEVLAMETMSAMPIEKSVVMAMVVVSSENIESLQTPGGILSVPR